MYRSNWGQTRNVNFGGGEVSEAVVNLFVNCWEVEVGGEGRGAGGEEVECGYSEGGGDGESGGAEEVNDEGADG